MYQQATGTGSDVVLPDRLAPTPLVGVGKGVLLG